MKKKELKAGVDDLYTRYAHTLEMLETAVDKIEQLEKELDKKPKEVIVEKVVEIIKEVPVEVEKIEEKIVEKIVEVEKVVEVVKEVEVPGPEREKIVEQLIEIPTEVIKEVQVEVLKEDTTKIESLNTEIEKLKKHNTQLEKDLNNKEDRVEIEIVEKESTKDLRHAANIMASSELNKEDLSADDIYNILVKSSEEELKQKLGFWAVPLPKKGDIQDRNTNLTYVRKK